MRTGLLADIFCRVVDNYGDIGVCWRLARRLAQGHGWNVRLWVDDLATFHRLESRVAVAAARQSVDGIEIVHWIEDAPTPGEPGDVVIEAFACDPPAAFVKAMAGREIVWINLEYLSAERWVESCHGLPSPRADGLRKFFFFPGFSAATGGLLREPGLLARRDALQADPARQQAFLARLGLDDNAVTAWKRGAQLVSLFCYANAPTQALLEALARGDRPTLLLVPEGVAPDIACGRSCEHPRLTVFRIPFLTSDDYDQLLWCSDLNFVRGEDSFVRALWAARPLVWQIYPQEEDAHLRKLDAWLNIFPAPQAAHTLIRAWNDKPGRDRDGRLPVLIRDALHGGPYTAWRNAAAAFSADQAGHDDLADTLALFCTERLNTR